MTITFKELKDDVQILTEEEILYFLKKDYNFFYSAWIVFNQQMYPEKKIDEYIIDLPVVFIDEIISTLRRQQRKILH